MEYIYLVFGIILALVMGYLMARPRFVANLTAEKEKSSYLGNDLQLTKEQLELERKKTLQLSAELTKVTVENSNLQTRLFEQKEELEKLQERFTIEFENLANKILEEKSRRFTEQNKSNLDDILKPLNEKIKDFEKRVNEIYVSDTKERVSLAEQIRNLHELNQQMSREANNLTRALKGDTKTQGSWGEFILESILEKSGLTRDREFSVQTSIRGTDGLLHRPDVIINLPENKSMIIDSKVSLSAYEAYCSAEDEESKRRYLNDHILSVRNHIKKLSPKEYQNLYGLQSLDFVLMFVAIEPAFALAVQNDPNIFYEAFEKNIVIVSPSTLLATLRTIASIWKQEKQNKHALEIAKQSGDLYDKFVGFTEDMMQVGNNLRSSKESYERAMNKLVEGRGNIIKRIENIKELGAKATKSLQDSLLEKAEDSRLPE